jgi:hypothetical protein
MTLDGKDAEPEFDPATWTPDKPWPKGYYKPVLGIQAAMERVDRITGRSSEDASRQYLCGLLILGSQLIGLFAALNPRPYRGFGPMFAAINRTFTVWPPLIFFTLLLPALFYAALVPKPGTPFRRSLAYGLLGSLAPLAFLLFMIMLRPLLDALFDWVGTALQP